MDKIKTIFQAHLQAYAVVGVHACHPANIGRFHRTVIYLLVVIAGVMAVELVLIVAKTTGDVRLKGEVNVGNQLQWVEVEGNLRSIEIHAARRIARARIISQKTGAQAQRFAANNNAELSAGEIDVKIIDFLDVALDVLRAGSEAHGHAAIESRARLGH